MKNFLNNFATGFVSGYESWRILAGGIEVTYAPISDKRVTEIESYANSITKNKYATPSIKRKAQLLASEARSNLAIRQLITKYKRV